MIKFFLLGIFSLSLFFNAAYCNENAVNSQQKSFNLLSQKMKAAIEKQIAMEQYSSNLYLSFASYFADLGFDGCEAFFRAASADESYHATLFFNHLIDRNEKVSLSSVNAITVAPTSVLDGFTKLLENEMKVTAAIHRLYAEALEESDYASQVFLHSFLLMQIEEEKEAQDLVQLLLTGPSDPAFLLLFDNKLAELSEEEEG